MTLIQYSAISGRGQLKILTNNTKKSTLNHLSTYQNFLIRSGERANKYIFRYGLSHSSERSTITGASMGPRLGRDIRKYITCLVGFAMIPDLGTKWSKWKVGVLKADCLAR